MFSKLSIVCVAALAVVAQAEHKHHTHSQKNGTLTHHPFPDHDHKPSGHRGPSGSADYPGEDGISSGVAPYPTGTSGYSPLSSGAFPRLLTTSIPVPTYTTTSIVTKLTTYCPGPTSLTQNGKTYTVTEQTTLTISDCPCTSTYTITGFPTPTQLGDTTLTYVVGTGSSTTTVVTTIHHTSYKTNYNTVYTSAGQPGEGGENGASGPPRGYQTVRNTIQSTIYVSASPTIGSGPGSPGEGEGAATGSVCAAPGTVTVTGPEQTVTVTTTSNPDSGPSPYSAVVAPPISSAPISVSAPYVMNNGTQPTGTGASTGFLTRPAASFTLKPSSGIAPSSGVASDSGTTPSSGIALSSNVASPSGTAPSSSSSVWPAAMATVVMQAYI